MKHYFRRLAFLIGISGMLMLTSSCGYSMGVSARMAADFVGLAQPFPPTDSDLPVAEPLTLPPGRVGQRLEEGGIAMTVLAVTPEDPDGLLSVFNEDLEVRPDETFITVDMVLENTTGAPLTVDEVDIELTSASGGNFPIFSTGLEDVVGKTIASNDQITGRVAFQVRNSATGLVLSYHPPELFMQDLPAIEVGLGSLATIAGLPEPELPPDDVDLPEPPGAPAPPDVPDPQVPASAGAGIAMIGERQEQAGVGFTVLSVQRVEEQFGVQAEEGEVVLVVDVLLENNSDDKLTTASLSFELISLEGTIYTSEFSNNPRDLTINLLGPGEQIQGVVTFAVDQNATGLLLSYTPLELANQGLDPFVVALGDAMPSSLDAPVAGADPATDPSAGTSAEAPTAPAVPPTVGVIAPTASPTAIPTIAVPTATPPRASALLPAPDDLVSQVTAAGSLRSLPRPTDDTVIAQVCPGDRVEILEQRGAWFLIRVFALAADCTPEHAALDTEGWLEVRLLTGPTLAGDDPVQAESATGTTFASVSNGGNIRNATVLADNTIIGQVCPGDSVEVLERAEAGDIEWYRVRVAATSTECASNRVAVGTEGWVSSILLSIP